MRSSRSAGEAIIWDLGDCLSVCEDCVFLSACPQSSMRQEIEGADVLERLATLGSLSPRDVE